jgi:hypothetical protein
VLLGAAAEAGLRGACLLGEMPQVFAQFPFPKASQAVLEAFATITGVEPDLAELSEQAAEMERRLTELLAQMQQAFSSQSHGDDEPGAAPTAKEKEDKLAPDDERLIERLFDQAARDRSKAYELKSELDRLGVYREYEDRFLDLFKRPG